MRFLYITPYRAHVLSVVIYRLVDFLTVEEANILIYNSLEGERTNVEVGYCAERIYHLAGCIGSVNRYHNSSVVDAVEVVVVIILLTLNAEADAENEVLGKTDRLLLLGKTVEVCGKL